MFKVVPDQLRVSEGWVRCGQCSEIFNASQHMVSMDPPRGAAPAPDNGLASADTPAPTNEALPFRATEPQPAAGAPAGTATQLVAPIPVDPEAPAEPASPATIIGATPGRNQDEPAPVPVEPRWTDPPAALAAPAPRFALPEGLLHGYAPAPVSEPDPIEPAGRRNPDPSFMRPAATSDSFWSRRPVRIGLFLLVIVLGALLVAQVLVQERNRIAQLEPATRPVLAALCALARCELGPLQQIESIVIDSSSFGRLRADNYRLAFSLRNTAPVGIAMPAIELSLTDTQDKALIRRVLLPAEFGAPAAFVTADSEWNGNLTLSVRQAPDNERIAGYRLLAFYP
jgi:predicted Zn finger-like uncharacterized protein